jgi:hypothetical protein
MSESFTKEAWRDLSDLMEVCHGCQAAAIVGLDLYAEHLYLAHLRNCTSMTWTDLQEIDFQT